MNQPLRAVAMRTSSMGPMFPSVFVELLMIRRPRCARGV